MKMSPVPYPAGSATVYAGRGYATGWLREEAEAIVVIDIWNGVETSFPKSAIREIKHHPSAAKPIRPMWQLAQIGLARDAAGYNILALWIACFMQAYEATGPFEP